MFLEGLVNFECLVHWNTKKHTKIAKCLIFLRIQISAWQSSRRCCCTWAAWPLGATDECSCYWYRVCKTTKIFASISSNLMRIIKICVGMFVFCHWNGCFQFMLAQLDAPTSGAPAPAAGRIKMYDSRDYGYRAEWLCVRGSIKKSLLKSLAER